MPCVDETKNKRQCIQGRPVGDKPLHRNRYFISSFPIISQGSEGSLCSSLMMASQIIDPLFMLPKRRAVAWEHEFHVHFAQSCETLKMVGQGIGPIQQKLHSRGDLVS
jgi:hypothetical protein